MNDLFKLKNTVKYYDWGSPVYIPRLLGIDGGGRPWAELWMGVHPGGPSAVEFRGKPVSLPDLIAGDRETLLGKEAAEQFGGLPFLFKLLAAAKPLSIQAHPNREQARRGFDRENREGIALDAFNRNYKDPNHKPEILCALSPFTALCGFRDPGEIRDSLGRFLSGASPLLHKGMAPLLEALTGTAGSPEAGAASGVLRAFFSALFALSPEVRDALTGYIIQNRGDGLRAAAGSAGKYLAALAERCPGDPAIIAPLYLNVLDLRPGEAVYLEAGVLHAYLEGFGVELMSNSDNVLRGGLSPKHIDLPELMRILTFSAGKPEILKPPEPEPAWYTYAVPAGEFSLSVMHGRGTAGLFPGTGPAILVLTGGEARFSTGKISVNLRPGESVFIPPRRPGETLRYDGSFTAYIAALPARRAVAPPEKGSGGR
jgi:mannose-6-phosphate isomerase